MAAQRVYFHTRGREVSAAWPSATSRDHSAGFDPAARPAALDMPKAPAVYLAHSYGAIIAALTHRVHPATALVLVEPALYDIARGHHAVERHIAAVQSARSAAARGGLWPYWVRIRPLMFGGDAHPSTWADERAVAEAFYRRTLPWGHGITGDALAGTPMLVVSGGWNGEYEEIAARLEGIGARHVILDGYQHRPMDHPDFAALVDDFCIRF